MIYNFQNYSLVTLSSYFRAYFFTLIYLCRSFEHKHPLFIGALYWFGGIFSRSFPISSLALIVFLSLFSPQRKALNHLFLFFLWLFPAVMIPYIPAHTGTAQGSFFIKSANRFQTKKEHSYSAEFVSCSMLCCKNAVPQSLCYVQSKEPLVIGAKYFAQGLLTNQGPILTFTPNPSSITPLPQSVYGKNKLALRSYLQQLIQSRFSNVTHAAFASSLLLGFPLPPTLRALFQKKGLAHIFVVSGWHFSLFFFFFVFVLKPLPRRHTPFIMLLFFGLLAYVFPWSPSVCRAWVSYSLFCCSMLTKGTASSLNRLGGAAIICSFFFPPMSPSFVLSFLATLGIILFYHPIIQMFVSPWRRLRPRICFKFLDYVCRALALSLASQLFTCVPILTFFKALPLDGLLLNTFFPLFIFPIFFLIILSLISPLFVSLAEIAIQGILSLPILHTPNILITLHVTPGTSFNFTLISLLLLFLGIILQKKHPLCDSEECFAIL